MLRSVHPTSAQFGFNCADLSQTVIVSFKRARHITSIVRGFGGSLSLTVWQPDVAYGNSRRVTVENLPEEGCEIWLALPVIVTEGFDALTTQGKIKNIYIKYVCTLITQVHVDAIPHPGWSFLVVADKNQTVALKGRQGGEHGDTGLKLSSP